MTKVGLFIGLFMAGLGVRAEVTLDPVFSSNMMLQQNHPVTFFGTADKGTAVQVDFAGKTASAEPDAQGKWQVVFPAMKAGSANYALKVTDGRKTLRLHEILIGDVWICAGQSNMEMPLGNTPRRGASVKNCVEEVARARYPEIRYVRQRSGFSHNKFLRPANSGWRKCTPAVAHLFSGTAYFFGRQLHQDLKTPIGLINIVWGSSRIEPWISPDGYKTAKLDKELAEIKRFNIPDQEKQVWEEAEEKRLIRGLKEFQKEFNRWGAGKKAECAVYAGENFDDSKWSRAVERTDFQCAIARWFRTRFTLPENMQNKVLTLSIPGKPGEVLDIYLNGRRIGGWEAGIPQKQKKFSIPIKPEDIRRETPNTLAVRAEYYYSKADLDSMFRLLHTMTLSADKIKLKMTGWKDKDEFLLDRKGAKLNLPQPADTPYLTRQFPGNIYNAMVDGWTKLPVKGIVWYQGCSNAGETHYDKLLRCLIADWRAKWKNPVLPFLIVQLAGYGNASDFQNNPFALIRDIQAQMVQIPNVGLACAIDIGEQDNIHPANKQDVGYRLALEAERIAYGRKIVSRGPMFAAAKTENGQIRISWENADSGLKTCDGKAPNGFTIAGKDGVFIPATARIEGKTVVVHSPRLTNPVFVRYAYAGFVKNCNLQNREGLPAYPFRSDSVDYAKEK